MLRASSSTTSTLRPRSTSFEPCRRSSSCRFASRQIGHHAVKEQGRLVEQPLRRLHVLEHDALGHRLAAASPRRCVSSFPVNTTTGRSRSGRRPASARAARSRSCRAGAGPRRSSRMRCRRAPGAPPRRSRRPRPRCRRGASSSTMLCRSMSLSSITSSRFLCGVDVSLDAIRRPARDPPWSPA